MIRSEGGALMNEISALIKGTPESSLAPFCQERAQQKVCHLEPGSEPWHLVLGLPSLQNSEKQMFVVSFTQSVVFLL